MISSTIAKGLAYKEYDKFKIKQDKLYKSDFDIFINETKMIENGSDKKREMIKKVKWMRIKKVYHLRTSTG